MSWVDSSSSSTENDHLRQRPLKRRKLSPQTQCDGDDEDYCWSFDDSEDYKGRFSANRATHDASTSPIYNNYEDDFCQHLNRTLPDINLIETLYPTSSAVEIANEQVLVSDEGSTPSQTSYAETKQVVCFGMVTGLPFIFDSPSMYQDGTVLDVIYSPFSISLPENKGGEIIGRITDADVQQLLSPLHDDPEIKLQLYVLVNKRSDASSKALKQPQLNVIVYGPIELFEDVGEFFQQNDCYLQKPRGCSRNVQYRNPHCIAGLDSDAPWTFDLDLEAASLQRAISPYDVLAGLDTQELLPEAEDPEGLKTSLHRHQKQALSFMQRRERGWQLHVPTSDVWSMLQVPSRKTLYVNNVTNDKQYDAPPEFRGGLLADDMGLGKTLTVIALIASKSPKLVTKAARPGEACPSKATLIVVPSSLLQEWQSQLKDHLVHDGPYSVSWKTHHGNDKLYSMSQINEHKIILTSYQTLASEYRAHIAGASRVLFTTFWHRIVLDEAHSIRNRGSVRARAVLNLEGSCRWVVTGTPVQNNLSDFASLLGFLRVYPYCNPKTFKNDIVNVWKKEDEKVAIERVTRLFKFISIRRTRTVLDLPDKTDLIRPLEFTESEMKVYRGLESPIVQVIERELQSDEPDCRQYAHTLLKINRLRKFCNLGHCAEKHSIEDGMDQLSDLGVWSSSDARIILEDVMISGQVACSKCDSVIQWATESDTGSDDCPAEVVYMAQCLQLICSKCYHQSTTRDQYERGSCSCQHPSHIVPVSLRPNSDSDGGYPTNNNFSTKVLSLKSDLQRHPSEKSVVFSSWTTTLDMISSILDKSGIKYVRIDGTVSTKNRAKDLCRYQHDSSMQVILLSISCGAEGLNLTAASRVYLMEPQWNPNLEAQALARVYRLGQTKMSPPFAFV